MGLSQITDEQEIAIKIHAYKSGDYSILDLFKKQIDALEVLNDYESDELVYGGAAGGGKSWMGDEWLLWNCLAYPETRWFIGRDNKQQIRNSTIVTFRKVCKKHKIPSSWWKYDNQTVKITFANGSIIDGLGLHYQPSDPDYDELGSTEYTGGWIEEGGGIHEKAKEVLSVRIGRHHNDKYNIRGKMLITANPSKNWIYKDYYKPFRDGKLPKAKKFIQSLITDNSKREKGYLEKLQNLKGTARERLLEGNWEYDNDPNALTDYESIINSFDNSHLTGIEKYITADIATRGSDEAVIGFWKGWILEEYKVLPIASAKGIEDAIREMKVRNGVQNSNICYDSDGIGDYLGSYIIGAKGFVNAASPLEEKLTDNKREKPNYRYLKTQCEFKLAEKINKGEIWLKAVKNSDEIEKFTEELGQLKEKNADSDGKKETLSKEDIKANIGRSPDRMDMLKMRVYFDLVQRKGFSMS